MKKHISIFLSLLVLSLISFSAWGEVVNLNKADAAAFQQFLTGIGPVKAQAIVKYRSKNGAFESLDELIEVPGIGNELLKTNRKSLSLKSGVTKSDAKSVSEKKSSAKKSVDSKKKSASEAVDKTKKSAKKSASEINSKAKAKASDAKKQLKKNKS